MVHCVLLCISKPIYNNKSLIYNCAVSSFEQPLAANPTPLITALYKCYAYLGLLIRLLT